MAKKHSHFKSLIQEKHIDFAADDMTHTEKAVIDDLDKIKADIQQKAFQKIYINIGGGQKNHTLMLVELYDDLYQWNEITKEQIQLMYPQSTKRLNIQNKIYYWEGNPPRDTNNEVFMDIKASGINLVDILTLYGVRGTLKQSADDKRYQYDDLYPCEEFRNIIQKIYAVENQKLKYKDLLYLYLQGRVLDKKPEYIKDIDKLLKRKQDINFNPFKKLFEREAQELNMHIPNKHALFDFMNKIVNPNNHIVHALQHLEKYQDCKPFSLFNALINQGKSKPQKKQNANWISHSKYFELIIQNRIETFIRENELENIIQHEENMILTKGRTSAEFDVILLSKSSRIMIIDAKIHRFKGMDYKARLYTQRDSFGYFCNFYSIVYCPINQFELNKAYSNFSLFLPWIFDYGADGIQFFIYDPIAKEKQSFDLKKIQNDKGEFQYILSEESEDTLPNGVLVKNQFYLFDLIRML